MAIPAASSAAELIRGPEDSRWMDLDSMSLVRLSCRWALNASMFVLMRRDTDHLLDDVGLWPQGNSMSPLCARNNRRTPAEFEAISREPVRREPRGPVQCRPDGGRGERGRRRR